MVAAVGGCAREVAVGWRPLVQRGVAALTLFCGVELGEADLTFVPRVRVSTVALASGTHSSVGLSVGLDAPQLRLVTDITDAVGVGANVTTIDVTERESTVGWAKERGTAMATATCRCKDNQGLRTADAVTPTSGGPWKEGHSDQEDQ